MIPSGFMWASTDADGCNGIWNIFLLARWLRSVNFGLSQASLHLHAAAMLRYSVANVRLVGGVYGKKPSKNRMKEQSPPPIHEFSTPHCTWLRFDAVEASKWVPRFVRSKRLSYDSTRDRGTVTGRSRFLPDALYSSS